MTAIASLETGLQFAQDKQYAKAINEFTSLLSQDQTKADVFFYRGCAYLHLGQYQKAINDFSSAISSIHFSSKHELSALYKRGYAYYKTNQFDPALDDYRHYLNLCKNQQEQKHLLHKGFFQMGIIYAALNENTRAILYFSEAIESSTDTEEDGQKLYYLHRGRAYACDAKYDKAQADLQLTAEKSDEPFIQGCAYNELGQHRNALTEFDNLLQSDENKSKFVRNYRDHVLFRRGLSSASLNFHDQALTYFQSALNHSKQPSSSNITDRILFRKGMSNMALNHTHQALIDFNESTKLNDNQSDVFYARGMIHYTLGRHDAAVYDQRKAMEMERNSPSLAPVHKTTYYTAKDGDNYNNYIYYDNKIHEVEELLKKHKDTPNEPSILREKARYSEKKGSHSNDPLPLYQSARGDITNARKSQYESVVANSVALAINSFYMAHHLAEKYSTEKMPETAIEQYINCTVESILNMSKLLDKCVINQDWDELVDTLRSELNRANIQRVSNIDKISIMYVNNQLEKIEIMKKTMDLFADSPAQQEFYGLIFNRLCNLFDGVRSASTGIFPHTLQGTCTKVSWVFKLLEELFEYVPIGSQYGKKVFGLCETGLKTLDETRIQNALNHLGRRCNPMTANQIADTIATELTKMYENQIKKFPTTKEEEPAEADSNNNNQQQQSTNVCSKCASCFQRCCHYCQRQKNRLLNDTELSTIETIVEYGASLFLSCLIRLDVNEIKKPERIPNVFINGVCRPSKLTFFHIMVLADKIKPKDANNDKECWDTYDFFRRPAIDFENGTIRAQKEADITKFGCRKPTLEEKNLLKTKPEELNKFGFKITIVNENSS